LILTVDFLGTQEVRAFKCTLFLPINIYLVDTPGFDDTSRKDSDVLKEIAGWLTDSYQNRILLKGILYLHRISDTRMTGSAKKNLFMFKKLCGNEALKNVILLTTMWEKVDPTEGERRQAILENTEGFWGFMIQRGSKAFRHMNNRESALTILKRLVPGCAVSPPGKVLLAIQSEMVNENKGLDETDAGKELQGEFRKEYEKLQQDMDDTKQEMAALEAHDREMAEYLKEEQEKRNEELQRIQQESEHLKITMERLQEEKMLQLESRLLKQHREERKAIESMQRDHQAEMDRLKREQEEKNQEAANRADELSRQINELEMAR